VPTKTTKAAAKPSKKAKEAPKGGVKAAFSAVVKAVTKAVKSSEPAKPTAKSVAKAAPKHSVSKAGSKAATKPEKVDIKTPPEVPAASRAKNPVPVKPKPGALRGGARVEPEEAGQDDVDLDDSALEFAEDMEDIDTDAEMAVGSEKEDDADEDGSVDSQVTSGSDSEVTPVVSAFDQTAAAPADKSEKKRKRDEVKFDRGGDIEDQWQSFYDKSKGIKPLPYKMSDNFEARTPLLHKVLGWGYVLSSQNNRLEVLFKDGVKVLIANYKSS
jgi:hypothetical protein